MTQITTTSTQAHTICMVTYEQNDVMMTFCSHYFLTISREVPLCYNFCPLSVCSLSLSHSLHLNPVGGARLEGGQSVGGVTVSRLGDVDGATLGEVGHSEGVALGVVS